MTEFTDDTVLYEEDGLVITVAMQRAANLYDEVVNPSFASRVFAAMYKASPYYDPAPRGIDQLPRWTGQRIVRSDS
ncbi:protein of unknown function [Aminobacter niigataensis]|nr:protein of unknown function [Aminobacter niigataensis]